MIKRGILFLIIVCLALYSGQAQDAAAKGLLLPLKNEPQATGKTYALIIGISKYKNSLIPQLQFADKDAIAFKDYLLASGVDSNNIVIRTNENARYVDIMLDLDDICTNKAKAGDRVFIYFSGHGDVESHVITNDGYLLPYDAPKVVYAISAINVKILETYVATLSSKGVQVVVITDACHSGKLAGGLEGLKNIQTVLGSKWQDEIKILSCQPGELSLEGKQWGGGRGLFSYELINGMAGMADRNKDGKVTLSELNRYLADKVADDASPVPQNPMISGDMSAEISKVDQALLMSLSSTYSNELAAIDVKGFDEALLKGLDDSVKIFYLLFKEQLDSNNFGTLSKDTSAYFYYQKVSSNQSVAVLAALMQRNLVAAMIKNMSDCIARTVQNSSFASGGYTIEHFDYKPVLSQLLSTAKIKSLGLQAKLLYGSALNEPDILTYPTQQALSLLDSAFIADNNASYASGFYAHALFLIRNYNLSKDMALQAIKVSPGFLYPYEDLALDYMYLNKPDSAIYYIDQWRTIDTAKYLKQFNFHLKKIEYLPNSFREENFLKALSYVMMNEKDSASIYFMKCDSSILKYKDWRLSEIFYNTKDYTKAIAFSRLNLAKSLVRIYNDSIDQYFDLAHDSLGIASTSGLYTAISNNYFMIAACYIGLHQTDSALEYIDSSAQMAFRSFNAIYKHPYIHYYSNILIEGFHYANNIPLNPMLNPIRHDPKFKAIMRKYFPDQYKE